MSTAYAPQRTDSDDAAARKEKLIRMLKAEENDAIGYRQSDLQQQQITALKEYNGELYGDEEDGRSRAVTREVFETIQWTLPDLMRVMAGAGNIISMEETSEADEKYSKDAADYLNWIVQVDNRGFKLLHDFAFDALLQRNGFLACYWRDKEYRAPQQLSGLSLEHVEALLQDQNVEILAAPEIDNESEAGGFSLTIRRRKSPARAEICAIAPEDIRINGRAVDLESARYVGRVLRMLRGEAAKKWPDMAEEIMEYSGEAASGAGFSTRGEDVRTERFRDWSNWRSTDNEAAQEVQILEEYLRVDLNDDDYPETIRSYRMGDLLLEEEEIEENPFGTWTSLPVPHRLYGMAQQEITSDLQRQSTVLKRAGLDATYQSVVNREAYDKNKIVDLGELTATYAGAKIAVNGPPAEAIFPLTGGLETAKSAWEAREIVSLELENRTGATRQTQGLDPDALLQGPHSGKAIDLLQTAGGARKELSARHMGDGFEAFLNKLYRLVCRHQNEPRQVKIGGKWCTFDPRTWNSELRARVHTGLGTGNRDQTAIGIQWIAQFQDAVIEKLGPDNPMVTPKHVYRTFEEGARNWGYHSAEPFMSEPQDEPVTDPQTGQPVVDPETGQPKTKPWAPQARPDPAMAKVQADAQASQAEQALKQQTAEADHQLENIKAAAALELQSKKDEEGLQAQREKAALDLQLARDKAAAEIDLAERKALAEESLAREKMAMEFTLAREKMMMEVALEREKLAAQREMHAESTDASREMHSEKTTATQDMHSEKVEADVKISKNRPGGDLSE